MPGYLPTLRADSLKLYIGACAVGRARAGNTTLDLIQFYQLPGQPAATTLTAADVGCPIAICGGGPVDPDMPAPWFVQGALFHTTIATVVDGSTCTLAAAPVTSIYNTGFYTVIVYRRVLFQMDSIEFDSSITPGVRDTLKFNVLGMLSGNRLNPYLDRFTTICNGQPVYLKSSDPSVGDIFGGYIDTLTVKNYPGYPGVYEYDATCVCWASLAMRRIVPPTIPQVFTGVAGDEVFRKLVLWYCEDDSVSVSAESAPAIDLQAAIGANVGQLLDQVVSLISTASVGWYWTTDPWRCFLLSKKTSTLAPWNVTDGYDLLAGDQPEQVSIETTHNKMANFVYGLGAQVLLNVLTANIVGDGTSKTFNLPLAVTSEPTITLDGSPQTVGVLGVDAGRDWYWSQGSTVLTQDTYGTVLTTANTLVVAYEVPAPAVAQAPNVASLQGLQGIEGTSANYNYSFQVSTPILPEDLLAMTTSYETTYGMPAQTVTAATLRAGLKVGQLQSITFPRAGIDGTFLIASVKLTTKNNILRWDYTAFGGANIGDSVTGLVQFINRGGGTLSLVTPSAVIQQTPSAVQHATSGTGTGTAGIPCTLPNPVTKGNLIVVFVERNWFLGNPAPVVDNQHNVYTQDVWQASGQPVFPTQAAMLHTIAGASGTLTVTCSTAQVTAVMEFSKPADAPGVDVSGAAVNANPTLATTLDGDLIVTGCACPNAAPSVTSPETLLDYVATGTQPGLATAMLLQSAAGSFTSSLAAAYSPYSVVISVAFKMQSSQPPAQQTQQNVNSQGTVTHLEGALTSGEPIIGHGGGDVTVGTRTGVTDQFVTAAGSPVTGAPLVFEASGDAEAGALGQLVPAGGTAGQVLAKVDGTNYNTEWAAAASGGPYVHAISVDGVWMCDDYEITVNETPITVNGA